MLKYSIVADEDGGEIAIAREQLLKDCTFGPLRKYIDSAVSLPSADAAWQYLFCNTSIRALLTPRTLARTCVDAAVLIPSGKLQLCFVAEPLAKAVFALEFRHTLSA
jgi:hypothetical protein